MRKEDNNYFSYHALGIDYINNGESERTATELKYHYDKGYDYTGKYYYENYDEIRELTYTDDDFVEMQTASYDKKFDGEELVDENNTVGPTKIH